jgi:hypothetical protein
MADRPLSIAVRHSLILKNGDLAPLTREDGEIVMPAWTSYPPSSAW